MSWAGFLEAKGDVAGAKEHMAKYLELEPAPADVDMVRAHIDKSWKTAGNWGRAGIGVVVEESGKDHIGLRFISPGVPMNRLS